MNVRGATGELRRNGESLIAKQEQTGKGPRTKKRLRPAPRREKAITTKYVTKIMLGRDGRRRKGGEKEYGGSFKGVGGWTNRPDKGPVTEQALKREKKRGNQSRSFVCRTRRDWRTQR